MSTEFGITSTGFVIKSFSQVLNEKLMQARNVFGPDVDLRVSSPLRQWLEVIATEEHNLWKLAEHVYYSQFISTSAGDNLDLLGDEIGLSRRQGTQSSGVLAFRSTGLANVTVGAGILVETTENVQYSTDNEITIESGTLGSPKVIGSLSKTVTDYLPQPYDLNSSLDILWINSLGTLGTGTPYVLFDHTDIDYSYGYYDNFTFLGKSSSRARAYLTWNSPTRTLSKFYSYDLSATTYTDRVDDATKLLFGATDPKDSDRVYIGCNAKFSRITLTFSLVAAENIDEITVEYSTNNNTWTEIGSYNDGTLSGGYTLKQSGTIVLNFTESEWNNWVIGSDGEIDPAFHIRITLDETGVGTEIAVSGITIDNGVIPSAGGSYYIGVIGNQWENVNGTSVLAGLSGNANAEAIEILTSSVANVTETINQDAFSGGVNKESDRSFRQRLIEYPRSYWSQGNIRSRILSITGVSTASIIDGNVQEAFVIKSDYLYPTTYVYQNQGSFVDKSEAAQIYDSDDVSMGNGNTAHYVVVGSNVKFSRIKFYLSGNPTSGTATFSFWNGSAWEVIDNPIDETVNFSESEGYLSVILNLNETEMSNWIAEDTAGGSLPTTGNNLYWIKIGWSALVGEGTCDVVKAINESVRLQKLAATTPGTRNGIRVIRIYKNALGTNDVLIDESATDQPDLTDEDYFWCDYNDPSTIIFYKDTLEENDIVTVYYVDGSVGSNWFNVVVLPVSSPISDTLRENLLDELENIAPLSIGYRIIEAEAMSIDISGSLTYDTVSYDIEDVNDLIYEALNEQYFTSLNLGDTVYRNHILKIIMQQDGVIDVNNLIIKINGEHYDTGDAATVEISGANVYEFTGGNNFGTTIIYDAAGDDTYETTLTEDPTEVLAGNYYHIEPATGSSKGQIVFTGHFAPVSTCQFRLTYYSNDGNLVVSENRVAKLNSVAFT